MERIIDNYTTVLKRYSDFEGRSGRSEYWYFLLANMIISVGITLLSSVIGDNSNTLNSLYSLVVLLPGIAVGIRRLHDIGKSGWMLLVSLIPFIGIIWLLILMVKESDPQKNEYGSAPKIS